jgi:F420-0:gamma-glutamyl ligase
MKGLAIHIAICIEKVSPLQNSAGKRYHCFGIVVKQTKEMRNAILCPWLNNPFWSNVVC